VGTDATGLIGQAEPDLTSWPDIGGVIPVIHRPRRLWYAVPAAKVRDNPMSNLNIRSDNMADAGGIAADRLKSFIERIERLEEEKKAIAGDVKEVYAEAKSSGFDTKIIRQIVRLRKMEAHDREEQEQLLDLYKQAIGMA
jgi:uncharacterized protein (UPF0335 family)